MDSNELNAVTNLAINSIRRKPVCTCVCVCVCVCRKMAVQ